MPGSTPGREEGATVMAKRTCAASPTHAVCRRGSMWCSQADHIGMPRATRKLLLSTRSRYPPVRECRPLGRRVGGRPRRPGRVDQESRRRSAPGPPHPPERWRCSVWWHKDWPTTM
jgi:hypothetical protein